MGSFGFTGSASNSANGCLQPGSPGGNVEKRQNIAIGTAYKQEYHVSYYVPTLSL